MEWSVVATARNEAEAALTAGRLEAVDIPVLIDPGDAWAYMGPSSSYAIKVPAERLLDARNALA
jgi:hypothetical protein